MKTIFKTSLFIASTMGSQYLAAQDAGLVLPFQYFESVPISFDPGGSHVFPGVRASISNAELKVRPTDLLFIAPKKAKVEVTSFAANEFAGCAEVKNDSVAADELSAVYRETVEILKNDSIFLVELNKDELEAKRACKKAIVDRSPDKNTLCEISRDLGKLRAESSQDLTPTLEKLNGIRETVSKRLDTYGSQLGGFAGAVVELWDKAELEDVRTRNPGKSVQVVPFQDITFDFVAGEEKNGALSQEIPRRGALGFSLQGETVRTDQEGGTAQAVTKIKTGESTAIGIVLSRLGACSGTEFARFGTFSYNFDTYGHIRGEASYNRYDYYRLVKKNSTKNGFFTTKTSRSVAEEMIKNEAMKISAFGDDEVSKEEMRDRLQKAVEKKIVDQMATRATSDVTPSVNATELTAPPAGADVAGDNLLKCPDWRCQVGGYVLKTAASIWGKGATEDSFMQNWNFTVNETWSETTMFQAQGSSSAKIRFN
jgi:hypothetical protein